MMSMNKYVKIIPMIMLMMEEMNSILSVFKKYGKHDKKGIQFGSFQVILDNTNVENNAIFKLEYVREFNLVCLITINKSNSIYLRNGVKE